MLPSATLPDAAVELLNNETLVDVLGELSDRYDRVIIDSPALGSGVEARILASKLFRRDSSGGRATRRHDGKSSKDCGCCEAWAQTYWVS